MIHLSRQHNLHQLLAGVVVAICSVWWSVASCHAEIAKPSDPSLLHIEEVRWGFDNNIQLEEFNLLSLKVRNTSTSSWSGPITITRVLPGREFIGIPVQTELSLGPEETRWMQFTLMISDSIESWQLNWGGGKFGELEVQTPASGPRPTVLIYNPDAVLRPGGPLRRLPEELFPQTLAGTASLRGLILSEVPFWTGARARTLRDWLHGGGRVYLLQNDRGDFPRFPSGMDVLNQEASTFSVGSGVVKRLPIKLDDVDIATASRLIFNDDLQSEAIASQQNVTNQYGYPVSTEAIGWQRHYWAARELRKLAIFVRPWALIYIAAGCYLLSLFPFCYRLGTESSEVRWFYSAFFGSAFLFSLLFIGLSQIGGQASNRLRSLGVARELSDGAFDVSQWSMACARDEGEYSFIPPGSGAAVYGLNDLEQFTGTFDSPTGTVSMSMAPASTSGIFHRSRVTASLQRPQLAEFERSGTVIQRVAIRPGPDFEHRVFAAWIVHGDTAYPLDISKATWTLSRQRPLGISGLILQTETPTLKPFGRWATTVQEDETIPEEEPVIFDRVRPLLFAAAFQQSATFDDRLCHVPDGHVRLLVQCFTPDEFKSPSPDFPDQRGTTLFVFDEPVKAE